VTFKKKFSIRAIFVVMTLLVVALAYGQWRRQNILKEVGHLEEAGVNVMLKRGWWTTAWLPSPQAAQLDADEVAGGDLRIGEATYEIGDADERLQELREQLRHLRVGRLVVHFKKISGAQHTFLFDLSLGEAANVQYRLSDVEAPSLVPGQ
jgi:hypothetical protein